MPKPYNLADKPLWDAAYSFIHELNSGNKELKFTP